MDTSTIILVVAIVVVFVIGFCLGRVFGYNKGTKDARKNKAMKDDLEP